MSTRDDIRDLIRKYPSSPDRTRAALDAESAPAQMAASVLGDLGFTADDILDGLAADGTITILPLSAAGDQQAMDYAGFTPADREAFRAAYDVPGGQHSAEQQDLLVRYEKARSDLLDDEEGRR